MCGVSKTRGCSRAGRVVTRVKGKSCTVGGTQTAIGGPGAMGNEPATEGCVGPNDGYGGSVWGREQGKVHVGAAAAATMLGLGYCYAPEPNKDSLFFLFCTK